MIHWIETHKIEALVLLQFLLMLLFLLFFLDGRSLEYDEIWTLRNYVNLPAGNILTDVATPNNHVLNSLAVKLNFSAFDCSVFAMRLPALLGFAALFLLCWNLAFRFLTSPCARGAFLAAVLLDGALLHYAETARGYSL